jgi:glutathione S-transferase
MIKLYGYPASRSSRVLWALEELEVEYDYIRLDLPGGAGESADYKRLNPAGKVPTMVDDDFVLTESAAICIYLADKFPHGGLIPEYGTKKRALCEQWCFFVLSELEQPLWMIAKHRYIYDKEHRVPAIMGSSKWEFAQAIKALEIQLGNKEYIVGNQFSVADLLISHTIRWARAFRIDLNSEAIDQYVDTHLGRPALIRVRERESE